MANYKRYRTEWWDDNTAPNLRRYIDPWEETRENYGYTYRRPNKVDYWEEKTAYYDGRYRRFHRREESKGHYTDFRQQRKKKTNTEKDTKTTQDYGKNGLSTRREKDSKNHIKRIKDKTDMKRDTGMRC